MIVEKCLEVTRKGHATLSLEKLTELKDTLDKLKQRFLYKKLSKRIRMAKQWLYQVKMLKAAGIRRPQDNNSTTCKKVHPYYSNLKEANKLSKEGQEEFIAISDVQESLENLNQKVQEALNWDRDYEELKNADADEIQKIYELLIQAQTFKI